jgi:hypothetical protein
MDHPPVPTMEARAFQTQLLDFEAVLTELDRLERAARVEVDGPWSLGTVLTHCAQSVECSLRGYPQLKPALFRWTVGRLAIWTFLRRGSMTHDLDAPIPGLEPPPPDLPTHVGAARLRDAIRAFREHEGAFAPHLAFGPLSRGQYEQLHAMHLCDHLRAVHAGG